MTNEALNVGLRTYGKRAKSGVNFQAALQPSKKIRVIATKQDREELAMFLKKAVLMLATVATVGATAMTAPAEARGRGWGPGPAIGLGIAAGALAAGAYGAYGPYGYGPYYGHRRYYRPAYYGYGYGPGPYAYYAGPRFYRPYGYW
jgi:hypothetical protein